MPLQNRVTPFGEIVASEARGTMMGNRGILHDDRKTLKTRRWQHRTWIACRISFRGRHREVMTPQRYTELFFLDEAVAIAAGHRPCCECRRHDFHAWQDAWKRATGEAAPRADEMDAVLHAQRIDTATRRQKTWRAPVHALADGNFVHIEGSAYLVLGQGLLPWYPWGYGAPIPRLDGVEVAVLTPRISAAVLAAGYRPKLHPTVDARNI